MRLDLYQLSSIDKELPKTFINTILTRDSFSFTISFDKLNLNQLDEEAKKNLALISKRLNTLVIENTDNFLEFGLKNFGFGYPVLIKRDRNDPSKIIKAPLFIWHLDVERSYQNKNTWLILKDDDSPIKINEILISHLAKDEAVKIDKIPKDILEDGILDKEELLELTKNILRQLHNQNEDMNLKIERCPDAKLIDAISNDTPWIQWSGIFGIYLSQNETIIHSTEELLDRFNEFTNQKLILEQFQTYSISSIETDPSKEEIINTLTRDEIKLIQGPPGTGKSQSITSIVSNALANNAKCLIVCEKKTALDVIYNNLLDIGLSNFVAMIDDVNKDRKKIIEKARDIKESSHFTLFSQINFDEKYNRFNQLKREINDKHAEALKKVFGDLTWKQLIGLYLKSTKSGDILLLDQKLNYKNLIFNHREYVELSSQVEEAASLFMEVSQNSEIIFCLVKNSLFTKEYNWTVQNEIKKELFQFSNVLSELNKFLSQKKSDDYELRNFSIFDPESLHQLANKLDIIIDRSNDLLSYYSSGIELIGLRFDEISFLQNLKYKFYSLFSSKYKVLHNSRRKIAENTNFIRNEIQKLNQFCALELELNKYDEYKLLSAVKKDCEIILEVVVQLKNSAMKLISTSIQLESFESKLLEIGKKDFFSPQVKNFVEFESYIKIVEFYAAMAIRLDEMVQNMHCFESYHNWKYFCWKKSSLVSEIISALIFFSTERWKSIFDAWYYRGALFNFEAKSTVGFNKSDSKLNQLRMLYEELKKLNIQRIKHVWGENRLLQFSKINFNFNTLYNLRKNSVGPKNSLRKIIEKKFDLFTTLFPVILTNPVAANAIFPLRQGIFNIVIFDEASQLRISDTFTSLIRGQYKIITGDEHQMPPSNYFQSNSELVEDMEENEEDVLNAKYEQLVLAESESLLDYAKNYDKFVNTSSLDFHYRSKHPALIEFSNNAFYGGNLVPFPPYSTYKPIDFRFVNGRYDTRTNPEEIAEVMKIIIHDIQRKKNGKYPSVGIATFNINQRNLITETLNSAAENNNGFAKKLYELRENGLFVKNLENIQGDERDIIIISTTYGIKPDGTFSQNFARINRIEGYKLLNVLITRAKYKIYICTSIPREKYLSYQDAIKNEGNNKKGILYAYLAYAEAISNQEVDIVQNILMLLKEQSYEKPKEILAACDLSESPFEEEVYQFLLTELESKKIVPQFKIGGFRVDFLIKTKSKAVVLECDGKTYHSSEQAYSYDMYRQKELENLGFRVYRIWSTNWFQNKEIEIHKLLNFLESLES